MTGVTFDALLLLSFGGPDKPADVRPFLENVTRGRGVPPERLDEVEKHYQHFGGVSPINQLNLDVIAAVEAQLKSEGIDLPVRFGNRNWHPMVEDTVQQLADDGAKRVVVFPTSAYGGYSASRQYDEDIIRAREAVGEPAPDLVKLRQFFDHPLFIDAVADGIVSARASLPVGQRDDARLIFTAHSIPVAADERTYAPGEEPNLYSRQVHEAARLVAAKLGVADYDVVWQSRSGPPRIPWLAPDIVDHLDEVGSKVPAVIVSPIGFVSDHLEVVWDLDNEAAEKCADLGIGFARAATAGTDPQFAQLVVELIRELIADAPPRALSTFPLAGASTNGTPS
jgi:ferrochelatase